MGKKPMPVKKKVKAKPVPRKARDEKARQKAIAVASYEAQDSETQDVMDRIMERIGADNLFTATEILKDMAQMDVQVANYKFPPLCVECGTEIKGVKK